MENKFCFPGECARVWPLGRKIGVHRVGAGFDAAASTFQSTIVHFFVALAQKNGPHGDYFTLIGVAPCRMSPWL